MPIPEFIVELRKHVGHDMLWLIGTTAWVFRDGEHGREVLLVRRSDNGKWTPVTGVVEPGEHPIDTARREVLEETGVECRVERLMGVNVQCPSRHVNGDLTQYLDHEWVCEYVSGEARVADDESTEVRWYPLDALPAMPQRFHDNLARVLSREREPQFWYAHDEHPHVEHNV